MSRQEEIEVQALKLALEGHKEVIPTFKEEVKISSRKEPIARIAERVLSTYNVMAIELEHFGKVIPDLYRSNKVLFNGLHRP